jgi:hypothetical protein
LEERAEIRKEAQAGLGGGGGRGGRLGENVRKFGRTVNSAAR